MSGYLLMNLSAFVHTKSRDARNKKSGVIRSSDCFPCHSAPAEQLGCAAQQIKQQSADNNNASLPIKQQSADSNNASLPMKQVSRQQSRSNSSQQTATMRHFGSNSSQQTATMRHSRSNKSADINNASLPIKQWSADSNPDQTVVSRQ